MSETLRARLSSEQHSVVTHVDGPLLVVAGPGSGKTRVLTERIRYLLTNVPGHFRVLALTFTNKAAHEMKERLADLGDERERAFIGTLHDFCLEVLTERDKFVGIEGALNIFEQYKDRREVLEAAIEDDPFLSAALEEIGTARERKQRVDNWLASISYVKSHPVTCTIIEDEEIRRLLEAYDAGMRASNAYDFDDLLLLTYRLFNEHPKLSDIYRRLYKFICIDEAQDMNEAQYAVICALCGDSHRNVMMVGDPRQSIFGFNKSGSECMNQFRTEFGATRVELTANFRSSRAVVEFAQTLDPSYMVHQQLPVLGSVMVLQGDDEKHEAVLIADELQRLFVADHPDVEGGVKPSKCAILGRTRYTLLSIEAELKQRGVKFYKRLSASHENESDLVDDFLIALRILANPKDQLHWTALTKRWQTAKSRVSDDFVKDLTAVGVNSKHPNCAVVRDAIAAVIMDADRLDLMPALGVLKAYADRLDEQERLAIYEDVAVLMCEWDQYLRGASGSNSLASFLSIRALGGTRNASREGVALLTVHASKGLEFDVVFMAGMADGVFPDYRATTSEERAEEARNAFVAATRSRRLLYLTYPASRVMPWGDKRQQPSAFIRDATSMA